MMMVMIRNEDEKLDYACLEFFSHSEGDGAKSMSDRSQAQARVECAMALFSHSDGEEAAAKSNRTEESSLRERFT